MSLVVRFAPSPTGYLHLGNAYIAIVNWLFAKKNQGLFILRFDDTDVIRSKDVYLESIKSTLGWLGITWAESFRQLHRLALYNRVIDTLIKKQLLYPCYESSEELELQRRIQLKSGQPPIYNRSALLLSNSEEQDLIKSGIAPYWRFKLDHRFVAWDDITKGHLKYHTANISDPVLVRSDGMPLYTLTSVIDDLYYGVTHIIRGEDHITNTAVQIQLFDVISKLLIEQPSIFVKDSGIDSNTNNVNCFQSYNTSQHGYNSFTEKSQSSNNYIQRNIQWAHLPMLVECNGKPLSKRDTSNSIANLQKIGIEPITLINVLTCNTVKGTKKICGNIDEIIENFDLKQLRYSTICVSSETISSVNQKVLSLLSFDQVKSKLIALNIKPSPEFWYVIRSNISSINEVLSWWKIIHGQSNSIYVNEKVLALAAERLPLDISNINTVEAWIDQLKNQLSLTNKELYFTLRLALTGLEKGPDLKALIALMSRAVVLQYLTGYKKTSFTKTS